MKKSKELLSKIKDKFDLKSYSERIHLPIKNLSHFKNKFDLKTYSASINPTIWVEKLQDKLEKMHHHQFVLEKLAYHQFIIANVTHSCHH